MNTNVDSDNIMTHMPLDSKTRNEIRESWGNMTDPDIHAAHSRTDYCVIVKCGEKDALVLSELFFQTYHRRSAVYDGKTLSFWCGDVPFPNELMRHTKSALEGYFTARANP